jgi:hypothetical protein
MWWDRVMIADAHQQPCMRHTHLLTWPPRSETSPTLFSLLLDLTDGFFDLGLKPVAQRAAAKKAEQSMRPPAKKGSSKAGREPPAPKPSTLPISRSINVGPWGEEPSADIVPPKGEAAGD